MTYTVSSGTLNPTQLATTDDAVDMDNTMDALQKGGSDVLSHKVGQCTVRTLEHWSGLARCPFCSHQTAIVFSNNQS